MKPWLNAVKNSVEFRLPPTIIVHKIVGATNVEENVWQTNNVGKNGVIGAIQGHPGPIQGNLRQSGAIWGNPE